MASIFDDYLPGRSSSSFGLTDELGLGSAAPPTHASRMALERGYETNLSLNLPSPFNDLSEEDLYRGYNSFKKDYSAAVTNVSELGGAKRNFKNKLDDFVKDTLKPYHGEFLGNPPEFDPDYGDYGQYISEMESHVAQQSKLVGETGFFGGKTDEAEAAEAFLRGPTHKKLKMVKDKFLRLPNDYSRSQEALDKADTVRESMRLTKTSLPDQFRRAADDWKDEKLETISPLSDKALGSLLDTVEFEEPKYSFMGRLLNQDRIDPRKEVKPYLTPMGTELGGSVLEKQKKRLESYRNRDIEKYERHLNLRDQQERSRKAGWLFSESGYFGGHPLYMNEQERDIMDLDKAKKLNLTHYKGVPVDEAFELLGGEEALTVAQMMDTLWKSYGVYENMQLEIARSSGSVKRKKALQKSEVAEKAFIKSMQSAASMGLTRESMERMDKPYFFKATRDA